MAKPKQLPTVLFPEWAPDLSPVSGISTVISGVVPRVDGYGPFKTWVEFTQALPTGTRGYFFARRTDGSIAIFAGTSTRLYLLNNTTFAWADVSKGGAAYSTLVATDNWEFEQFNDRVIAVQANTVPQSYVLSSSATFADLAGSPPSARYISIVNRFVVLLGLVSEPRRVQWCDLDNPIEWTAGVGLADYQDLPDGGNTRGLSGGDMYGLIFQDSVIRSLVYAPGSAVVFQITRISENDPLFAPYSVMSVNNRTFFISAQGFKMVEGGGVPVAIGKDRVDQTFFADVDRGNIQLVVGAADPASTRVYWSYKSQQGEANLFDKIICYDPVVGKGGRFSLIPMSGQYLAALARPGLTLEQLDAIAPGALTVTGAANNGAGKIRLTLNAISNAFFAIAGQNFIVVQGVVGTTEANGTWVPTIIDATHIDLVGSTFTNAYVSGGAIGGSLDALPFSLDSVSTASIASLAVMSPNNKLAFFTGDNIEAILETAEQEQDGNLLAVNGARPICDAGGALLSIGGRLTAQDSVSYSTEYGMDATTGMAPAMVETRYARGRLRIPSSESWTYARGMQPDVGLAGDS